MFGNKKNIGYCAWIPHNFAFETHGKKKQVGAASCADDNLHHAALFSEQCSMPPSVHCSREQFFFFKKLVQLIDFTRTIHVNVNSDFFYKKISLR
jgi:hypothetical protein